jgi:hypothetical protein
MKVPPRRTALFVSSIQKDLGRSRRRRKEILAPCTSAIRRPQATYLPGSSTPG